MRGAQINEEFILVEYASELKNNTWLSSAVIHKLPLPHIPSFIKGEGITGQGKDAESAWQDSIKQAKNYIQNGKWA